MKKNISNKYHLIIIYLLYLVIVIVVLLPIAWTLSTSFKPFTQILEYPPRWIPRTPTLENYLYVIKETYIPKQFLNSLIVSSGTIVLTLIFAVPAGYGFARANFRGRTTLLFIIMASEMITGLSTVIAMYMLAIKFNFLNSHVFLMIVYTTSAVPFGTWFMKGFFESIPKELEDSALIDGCSRFSAFWRVILPLAKPGIAAIAIFSFITAWNEFLFSFILITESAKKTLPVGIRVFIDVFGLQWGYITATAIIGTIPIVILFLLLQKYFIAGLTQGAVKE